MYQCNIVSSVSFRAKKKELFQFLFRDLVGLKNHIIDFRSVFELLKYSTSNV